MANYLSDPHYSRYHERLGQIKEQKKRTSQKCNDDRGSSKRPRQDEDGQIKFLALNADIVEDLITISIVNDTYLVEKILEDDGSVVEVLMWEAFNGIGLDKSLLRPARPIYGFTNQLILKRGLVMLLVTLG